jgi:RND family efflux transporter MFP subunit
MTHTKHVPLAGLICASIAAAAMLAGCGRGAAKADVPTVAVAKTIRTNLTNSMTFQGEFYPYQDVLIHAKVSGYVNPIAVDIGDRVKAGQILATLEVPELKDQLVGARATVRQAGAEHEIAHLNYMRLVEVNRSQPNLVAQQDLDDARAKDSAMTAAMATATAEADRYSTLEDYTRVLAPFPGVITKRFVDNGSLVEAGTSSNTGPLVELAQQDLLRLRFPVPEAETPLVHVGGEVRIAVDAAGQNFKGMIARDAWDIDRSTRTIVVEVDVPNQNDTFKAGMYASVTLSTQDARNVLAVPLQALAGGDTPSVLVVNKDDAIESRNVTTGMRTASLVEVKSGLSDGDLVVVGDRSGLVPGTLVSPKRIDAPGSE